MQDVLQCSVLSFPWRQEGREGRRCPLLELSGALWLRRDESREGERDREREKAVSSTVDELASVSVRSLAEGRDA